MLDRTRTTEDDPHNIIWATDNYIQNGPQYAEWGEISIAAVSGENGMILRPRVNKSKEEQEKRSREKAEVFTPAWICNRQNNLVDCAWFGLSESPFNTETEKGYLNAEIDKLYAWADDNMYPLEDKVISLRKELQSIHRAAKKASSAAERIELKKKELDLGKRLTDAQNKCNEAREYYDAKSEEQIDRLQKSLENAVSSEEVFFLRWSIV